MFLGGFLGNEEQWTNLAELWRPALGRRKSFHIKEVFRKGKERRARDLLARLGPIPAKVGLRPLLSGIRMSDYWDLVEGTDFEKKALGYCTALYPLVSDVLLNTPKDERVEFTFESTLDLYEWNAGRIFNAIASFPDPRLYTSTGLTKIADWKFVSKESCMLTQPGDYIAFASLQWYKDPDGIKAQLCLPLISSYEKLRVPQPPIMKRTEIRWILENMLKSKRANAKGKAAQ